MRWIFLVLLTQVVSIWGYQPLEVNSAAIRYSRGELKILNQQKLPFEEEWIDVQSPEQMAEIITSLKVASGPELGVAAVLSLAQMAERGYPRDSIIQAAYLLKNARPSERKLTLTIDRVLKAMVMAPCLCTSVIGTAREIYQEATSQGQ